ncbi:MAG TPA: MFS transporter [Methylomirabilota bacterium]|jgi:FSR family fosmidomycin resistance protein-like MFS transporter
MTPDPSASAVALPAPVAAHAVRARPDMRLLGLLALGHMVIDINQGSFPVILPYLKDALNLSYAATGMIVLAANTTSSLIQPLFGYLADRTARRWILPVSVLLSAVGLGFLGLAPSYGAVLVLVMITGLGVASYHPEGYRTATAVAGDRRATGVSIFSTGGNIGIALGPPLLTALLTTYGLSGSLGMLVPGLLVAALFTAALPRLSAPAPAVARARARAAGAQTMVGAMALLILVVAIRSWTQLGFTTFMPFYWTSVLHGDPRLTGTLLAVFLGSGAIGTLVVGPVADRIGVRRYVVGVFVLAIPLALGFLFVSGGPLVFVLLALLGFVLVSTFTVSVVLGQSYLPKHPGMASGLIVGFAIGAGGLGASVLGWVADHWGLTSALAISAVMPMLAFVVALFLPEPKTGDIG